MLAVIAPPATPAVAVPITGAPGTVVVTGAAGVTAFDAADCGLVPIAFTAATRKVYTVPLVRPVIAWLVAVGEVTGTARSVFPPTLTRIVKPVIPVAAGLEKFTVARALPATTEVMVGCGGITTRTVWSLNFSCSMLNSVSVP